METVYKYQNIINDDFYSNPTMKISVVTHFNDPFEGTTTEEVFEIIEYLLRNTLEMDDEDFNKYNHIAREYIRTKLMANGVISLSDNSDNILLWSHYANNHKGMCIGLSPDFAIHKEDNTSGCNFTPLDVTYGDKRLNIKKIISVERFPNDLYLSHMLNKSKHWDYENEKRIIMPTHCADRILINPTEVQRKVKIINQPEFETSIKEWLPILLEQGMLSKDEEVEYYQPNKVNKLDRISPWIGIFEEVTFLMLIPHDKIRTIHFGCKVSDEYIMKAFELIKSNESKLNHIDVFKYELSPKTFELIPVKINK